MAVRPVLKIKKLTILVDDRYCRRCMFTRACGLQCGSDYSAFGGWFDVRCEELVVRYACLFMFVIEATVNPEIILKMCHGQLKVLRNR